MVSLTMLNFEMNNLIIRPTTRADRGSYRTFIIQYDKIVVTWRICFDFKILYGKNFPRFKTVYPFLCFNADNIRQILRRNNDFILLITIFRKTYQFKDIHTFHRYCRTNIMIMFIATERSAWRGNIMLGVGYKPPFIIGIVVIIYFIQSQINHFVIP